MKDDIVLVSSGFNIGKYKFKKFELSIGKYITLDFQDIHDFVTEKMLYKTLSGQIKNSNLIISKKIIPVISPQKGYGPSFLYRKTTYNYLKEFSHLNSSDILALLKSIKIDPKANVYNLGANERKLLSLEAAFSKSKNIIISTSGLDPIGLGQLKSRIAKEMSNGSLIEITYPTNKVREYLFPEGKINEKIIIEIDN